MPLVLALKFDLVWFGTLVAVNLQTAFLSPPVAMSAYYLKAVVPEWDLKTIYLGMAQFMVIQVIALLAVMIFQKSLSGSRTGCSAISCLFMASGFKEPEASSYKPLHPLSILYRLRGKSRTKDFTLRADDL